MAFLYTQETDTSITISHFQYPLFEGVPIYIDETGENTYFLDGQNPSYLIDTQIYTLQLDGSLGIPLGSYFLPNILPKAQDKDSVQNHSQIYYRKGDYDYNDLGIGLLVETADSGFFSYQGLKRSPPRLYQSQSSQLQTHLISYKRYMEKSNLRVDALYHLEDYDIPMREYNNREVESFHGGFRYEYNFKYLSFNMHPSFQFTYLNQWGGKVNHFTFWDTLKSTFHLWENFNLSFIHKYKIRMNEYNNQLSDMPTEITFLSVGYDSESFSLKGGIALYNSSLYQIGRLKYNWYQFYLLVERNFHSTFIPTANYSLDTMSYSTDVLKIGYTHRYLNGNVELFKYNETSDCGIKGNGNINVLWINLKQEAGIYNFDKDTNTQPIDLFSSTKMILSPNIWPWKTARYQPFIGMESVYIQYSGKKGIDPIKPNVFSNVVYDPFSTYLLNIEFGFLISGFKVSYRWVNFNLIGAKVNNSVHSNSYPIPPFRHLEVVWQFLN